MASHTYSVSAKRDHIESQTKAKSPILAISELIWNAFDADATTVEVSLERNKLDEIERIEVSDDGTGIDPERAQEAFCALGGSWKRNVPRTAGNRGMHGKMGKGRFKAFFLGKQAVWSTTVRRADGSTVSFGIKISGATIDKVELVEPAPAGASAKTGTVARIEGIETSLPSLAPERAVEQLARIFALYLSEYPNIRLIYDGLRVSPSTVINRTDQLPMGKVEVAPGVFTTASLTCIEWKFDADRALYLCDASGIALSETKAGIHAPEFNFTAYLRSDLIRDLDKDGWLVAEELHPQLSALIEAGRNKLKDHFRDRRAEQAASLVQGWKDEQIYPFQGEPQNPVDRVQRQVFDVLAANLSTSLPSFDETPQAAKRMAFSLVKHAIGQNPRSLQKIFEEVLNLPKDKQDDLAELLERTTLAAIINAAAEVSNRLDFLKGLEQILFEHESKRLMRERSQLHRILASETWLFGEEYHLTADDESLKTVLDRHLELLGRKAGPALAVVRDDGSEGIVDLMLSRALTRTRPEDREHLVIELKRPSQNINQTILQQVRSYATTVAKDDRFKSARVKWSFLVVANDLTEDAEQECNQANREPGIAYLSKDNSVTVWAKRWSQVIQDAEGKLRFFRERLDYAASQESGLKYLQRSYEKYLPGALKKAAAS